MALNFKQKEAIVTELLSIARKAVLTVIADYRGLTVSEMSDLRKIARNAGVTMGVYRNTLTRRAFKETAYICLDKMLRGPVVLFFSQEEPGAAARLIEKFTKEHEQLEVKALALGGKLLPADKLKTIAQLPSHEAALSQLIAALLAPAIRLSRTLNEPVAQIIRVIAAIRDQKQVV